MVVTLSQSYVRHMLALLYNPSGDQAFVPVFGDRDP
jgi:hypothetical protein